MTNLQKMILFIFSLVVFMGAQIGAYNDGARRCKITIEEK